VENAEVENGELDIENGEGEGDFVEGGEEEDWNFFTRSLGGSSYTD